MARAACLPVRLQRCQGRADTGPHADQLCATVLQSQTSSNSAVRPTLSSPPALLTGLGAQETRSLCSAIQPHAWQQSQQTPLSQPQTANHPGYAL